MKYVLISTFPLLKIVLTSETNISFNLDDFCFNQYISNTLESN